MDIQELTTSDLLFFSVFGDHVLGFCITTPTIFIFKGQVLHLIRNLQSRLLTLQRFIDKLRNKTAKILTEITVLNYFSDQ